VAAAIPELSRPVAVLATLVMLAGCAGRPAETVLSGPTQGTTWHLRAVVARGGPDDARIRAIVQAALDDVDTSMSAYRPDSALSRFNASRETGWFTVPAPLAEVVSESLRIGDISGGAFDITVAPLVRLWGFGTGKPRDTPPPDAEVQALRAVVGQRHLHVRPDPPALSKDLPGLSIDVDAIAQGYSVDLVAQRLEAAGIRRYMIEVGGEVRVLGRNAGGQPWRIGVERPDEAGRSVALVLRLTSGAVSTSGDYRDFFEAGGRRYSHEIDPRTGRPVTHSLASVTILRPTTTEADGLATALSVLGPDEGYALARRMDWAALFVSRRGGGFVQRETPAFTRAVEAGESGS